MSDIYESITQRVVGWKTIFKDNIESITGKSDLRNAAEMSWPEIMQLTKDTDYTIGDIANPTTNALFEIGPFTKEEKNILHTPQYKYLRNSIIPYISQAIPPHIFNEQAAANPIIISNTPELNWNLAGLVFHNFGNIKMLEMFYETSNEALTKLRDTLVVTGGYIASIKAVKNLEDIVSLQKITQDHRNQFNEIPF